MDPSKQEYQKSRMLQQHILIVNESQKQEEVNDNLAKLQAILADPNYNIDAEVTDTGLTALGYLCSYPYSENNQGILQLILEKNPDVMAKDKMSRTPAHLAASCGNIPVIEILYQLAPDKDAFLNCQTCGGETLLTRACKFG